MTAVRYVPILKGKEGEYSALEVLSEGVRQHVMPLIEVPPIPYDYVNQRPSRSLEAHLSGIPERVKRAWPSASGPVFLQFPGVSGSETDESGELTLEAALRKCHASAVAVVPVIMRESSGLHRKAVAKHAIGSKLGLALRLVLADFDEAIDLEAELARVVDDATGGDCAGIDLILDLGALGLESSQSLLIARYVLSVLPRRDKWRRLVLAASSFPKDLSDVDAESVSRLPRLEWHLWEALMRKRSLLARKDIIFGDYGIAHPKVSELDPRTMRMSASIRYTTASDWLVFKGKNVRQHGFEQYYSLAKQIVEHESYSGADFSWGDAYIAECAKSEGGPGNATTWRKVGNNHHITLVSRALADLASS